MIDTSRVYEDLAKDDGPEQEPASTTAGDDKVEKAATEQVTEGSTEPEVHDEVKDTTVASPKTDTDGDKNTEKQQQHTAQEKISYSFSKMKRKHREEVEALNKKIEEQQKIIDQFNAKTRDSFKSEDEYLDAKLDARDAQRELDRARQESLQMAERQQAESMRERVTKLYPSEQLQTVYTEALQMGQKNGALEAMMSDPVVKKYIFESEKSPLLVEAFSRKPALLEKILDTSDIRKPLAMYDLEQRLSNMIAQAEARAKEAQSSNSTSQAPATKTVPIVGKVANAGKNAPGPSDDWGSDDEAFAFVRSR